jgi:hypothetical protein
MAGSRPEASVCRLCHSRLGASWWETPLGESVCLKHSGNPLCRSCAAPAAGAGGLCPRCVQTAVRTQDRVRAVLPRVRTGLHDLGLRLTTPVRVRLISPDEMAALSGAPAGTVLGCTVSQDAEVVDLSIVAGLPAPQFGAVVAHECMHAWMVQRGFGVVPPPIAEGLSQFASDGWLERQRDPRVRLLREAIAVDPDPVYGGGFRQVKAAVRTYGLLPVLRTVRAHGTLP